MAMEIGVGWEDDGGLCVCLCPIQCVPQAGEMECQILEIQSINWFRPGSPFKKKELLWFESSSNGPAATAVMVVVVVVVVAVAVVTTAAEVAATAIYHASIHQAWK